MDDEGLHEHQEVGPRQRPFLGFLPQRATLGGGGGGGGDGDGDGDGGVVDDMAELEAPCLLLIHLSSAMLFMHYF